MPFALCVPIGMRLAGNWSHTHGLLLKIPPSSYGRIHEYLSLVTSQEMESGSVIG